MKNIDIFPLNFNFNIKDNDLLKTFWGGIFSVSLFVTSIALVVYNLYSYSKSQSPIVLISQNFIADKPPELLDISNLQFIPFFLNRDVKPIIFDIVPQNISFISLDINGTNPPIDLIIGQTDKCSKAKDNFSINLSNSIYETVHIDPNNISCLIKNYSIDDIKLGGSPVLTKQVRQIEFSIKYDLCSNKNFLLICRNNTAQLLNPFFLNIFFNNHYSDLNLAQGYRLFQDFQQKIISAGEDYIIEITVEKNTIYSDDNYLFNFYPKRIYKYYAYTNININSYPRRGDPNFATFNFIIRLDKYETNYYRSYMKLDQLLANTMSIFSVLLLLFENLTKIFEFKSVEYYLMKKLYYFNLKENCGIIKLESLIKNMKKKTNLSNYLLTLDMIEIELNVQSEKNDLNKIVVDKSLEDKNYKREEVTKFGKKEEVEWRKIIEGTKPHNLRIKKLLFEVCPCKSSSYEENMIKINKGQEMLFYDLNIVTILKKLIEFEKFKEILFNKNQIDLMNVFHTRKINSKMEVKNFLKNKLYKIKYDENYSIDISEAYENCLGSQNKKGKKIIQNLQLI